MRPLQTLLIAITVSVMPSVVDAQSPMPTQDEIIKLLRVDSGGIQKSKMDCFPSPSTFVSSELLNGDERAAAADATENVKRFAACALADLQPDPTNAVKNAAKHADSVGYLLGISLLLNPQPNQEKAKQRVITYLSFAKSDILLELFQRSSKPLSAKANEAAEYTLLAQDASAMLYGNSHAFIKKYIGRVLEITGDVKLVDTKSVSLVGHGDQVVTCRIIEPVESSKLDNVMPKMKVSIRGVYFGTLDPYRGNRIDLIFCRVVTGSTPSFGAPKQPE